MTFLKKSIDYHQLFDKGENVYKVRMLLTAFALVSAAIFLWGIYGLNYVEAQSRANGATIAMQILGCVSFLAIMVSPFACVGSLTMLFLSFFSLKTTAEGQLTYDANNWYWRLMNKMWYVKPNVSLCSACWLAAFNAFILSVLICTILMLGVLIWITITNGFPWDTLEKTGKVLALFVSILFCFVIWCRLVNMVVQKFDSGQMFKAMLYLVFTFGVVFLVAGVVPVMLIMNNGNQLALFPAILVYLKYAGILGGIMGVTSLMLTSIFALFKFLAKLSPDNLFKRFLMMAKDNACPVLHQSDN